MDHDFLLCASVSVCKDTYMLKGDKVHGFLKIKWYLFFSSMEPQPCRTKSKIILEATRWPSCSTFLVSVPICTSRKRTIASISVVSGTLVKTVKTVTKVYHLHLKQGIKASHYRKGVKYTLVIVAQMQKSSSYTVKAVMNLNVHRCQNCIIK